MKPKKLNVAAAVPATIAQLTSRFNFESDIKKGKLSDFASDCFELVDSSLSFILATSHSLGVKTDSHDDTYKCVFRQCRSTSQFAFSGSKLLVPCPCASHIHQAAAIGAVAVGAFAIGKLHIGRAKIKNLHIGTLVVDDLIVKNRREI